MTTQLSERQLKKLIQDSVSEAINMNLMKLRALALPFVPKKEQQEIERLHGVPSVSERPTKTVWLNV
ncbi:MAG: hypothetical protein HY978_00865 [Candidatus Liptonbacteria bacterium]|nr:hypothetical protein [Candidatus Liptonbacteria bacterium]